MATYLCSPRRHWFSEKDNMATLWGAIADLANRLDKIEQALSNVWEDRGAVSVRRFPQFAQKQKASEKEAQEKHHDYCCWCDDCERVKTKPLACT